MSVGLETISEQGTVDTLEIPEVSINDPDLTSAIFYGLRSLEIYVRQHRYTNEIPSGEVISRIGDVCIEVERPFNQLPNSLQLARAHAHDAEAEAEKGIRSRGLALVGVMHAFEEALYTVS